jgi:hypothetical protein
MKAAMLRNGERGNRDFKKCAECEPSHTLVWTIWWVITTIGRVITRVAKVWDYIMPVGTGDGRTADDGSKYCPEGTSMQIVLGPVLTRKGGYVFDCWTPEEGLSCGYIYGRIDDAHYARNVEIRSCNKGSSDRAIACSTVYDFARV